MSYLAYTYPWISAAAILLLALVGYAAGRVIGQGLSEAARAKIDGRMTVAGLSLLALLLGFNLSMALTKYDQKRLSVVAEANAVNDFFDTASLLDGPIRDELQRAVRDYAKLRVTSTGHELDEQSFQKDLADTRASDENVHRLVRAAVAERPPVVVPLVITYNDMTSTFGSRVAATRDRIPMADLGLLLLATVLSMLILGIDQGASGVSHVPSTVGFTIVACLTIGVILDLSQPYHGAIVVSQEPMQRLLENMK